MIAVVELPPTFDHPDESERHTVYLLAGAQIHTRRQAQYLVDSLEEGTSVAL